MNILEISHITKSFGSNRVIDNLSFSVPEHSVFGFVGQNGAGKTTTMKIVLGLLKADSGEIFVNGEKVSFGSNTTNRFIGYLPDVPEFYNFMTSWEYLMLCGQITGMPDKKIKERSVELLELVGLENSKKRIRSFSRGMKQRLGIAQALLNSPRLLICDEPTSALDPIGRKEILDILHSVREHTTVLFSTHILSDMERICDRIAFLHDGHIVRSGTMEEIRSLRRGDSIEIEFSKEKDAALFSRLYGDISLRNRQNSESTKPEPTKLILSKKKDSDMIEIMKVLSQNNISIQRLERLEPTLEDLFMEVVDK